MPLWLPSPARASAKRKVQKRFTTSCDCCVFVAFLLRIRSLNLLYISRKHFSAIQCLYVM
ncbi:hypothetical protein EY084_17380 [Shigella flexneri]|nr:hypothetical protein [Shigella flexneri]